MNKLLLFAIILISCNFSENRDNNHEKLASEHNKKNLNSITQNYFNTIDSIVLVLHDTYDNSPPDIKTGQLSEKAELIVNDSLNRHLVKQTVRVLDKDKIILAKILDEIVVDNTISSHCFNPHNSILAYKNNTICYLDICFDCLGIYSKQFPFEKTMNGAKYEELKKFFSKYGIK